MNKPSYISFKDWDILKDKYDDEELNSYFEKNYPYQYLIGNVDFCDNIIEINENVLIPRFETENFVYKTIDYIKNLHLENPTVLDIGTGSGCIIISIAKMINGKFDALDISKDALSVAKKNAINNHVDINFSNIDFLIEQNNYNYDVIISNPPYIDKNDKVGISTKYEPQNALFADNRGLIFYQEILKKCNAKLFAFEIGCTQSNEIESIAKEKFPNCKVIIEEDFENRDRYLFIINE